MKPVIISMIVIALAASGCHPGSSDPRVNMASGVRSDTAADNIITRPVVKFVSVLVGEGIEVNDLKERRTSADLLEVQLSGYNHALSRRKFDYRVEWLDADGMVLSSTMTKWTTVSVMPKSEFSFRVISPNARAENYRINTRPNRTVE
jgi:uncharacterized protein YcfL